MALEFGAGAAPDLPLRIARGLLELGRPKAARQWLVQARRVAAHDPSMMREVRLLAAEIEKMKKVINEEPDQNVRLAAFQLMVESSNSVMREIAIESGLASADKLLQSAAFRAAIMDLDRLHLVIKVDPDASDEIRQQSHPSSP